MDDDALGRLFGDGPEVAAARIPVGDQGLHIVLRRRGVRVQHAADPYAAALAVLRGSGRGLSPAGPGAVSPRSRWPGRPR
ncbi:hypothetical protein G5V59_15715 [Nocardioides sp. W3-2-3]|uniref:hypothetical protein n=1 Tax=Nocardioides convexus TaxID=2712224 RepID=UPI002418913A|nr:hypothetical protein [Nocardioides convexus]NHA00878.1 hypothetical protein [Nocardioides convexus]